MKDEDFQLDATEDKNNLLNNMFTGTVTSLPVMICYNYSDCPLSVCLFFNMCIICIFV